jgi:hypothetical protein
MSRPDHNNTKIQWIMFSDSPLGLQDAAEAATIRLEDHSIEPDDRFFDASHVLWICLMRCPKVNFSSTTRSLQSSGSKQSNPVLF